MFIQIPMSHALSKGCDLWILPSPASSTLAGKVDMHLQFINRKTQNPQKQPLLMASSQHLPNKHTLFLFENPTEKWINSAECIWKSLQKPSARIFLPENIGKQELFKHWTGEILPYKIHIVLEKYGN